MTEKKYIVVTGGVISGIGKGVATASTGFFLSESYKTITIKLDGYLNVDPGTMNPKEHGEVFVLTDGGEVDMDFGHYERFFGTPCKKGQSISMGKVFTGILEKERRGDFLGKTVQMIPHVTDYIIDRIEEVFAEEQGDICMIEIGGTVGDIEAELYFEAIRQMRQRKKRSDFVHIHLTYIPIPAGVKEQKTKPTQQSINLLQSRGLFPDFIFARGEEELTPDSRRKIALFSNLDEERIFSLPDVASIYTIPEILKEQGLLERLGERLKLDISLPHKLKIWKEFLENRAKNTVKVGIVGKYTALEDSYSSVVEALKHSGAKLGIKVEIHFIDTRNQNGITEISQMQACIIPGGFGDTGIENMITALTYIRENQIPCLGICLGLQLMVIEYARNILGIPDANSLEFSEKGTDVITLLDEQKNVVNKGGTMRLGEQNSLLEAGAIQELYAQASRLSEEGKVAERFRHRYEVHPEIALKLASENLRIVGRSEKEGIVQFIEMNPEIHPYYVGTQSHPELTSRLENPAPLFVGLLQNCKK